MSNKPNWRNQSVFVGDNIDIMRGMNSESADQICTDPPFNSNRKYEHNFEPGKRTPGFDDTWSMDDVRKEEFDALAKHRPKLFAVCLSAGHLHSMGMRGYLVFMATRLMECHRILKETGSMYLHCDPTADAYLRLMMDAIFGHKNFRNQIIWSYKRWSIKSNRCIPRLHDTIHFYAKSEKTIVHPILVPNTNPNPSQYVSAKDASGKTIVKRDAKGNPIKRKISSHLPVGSVWELPIISPNGKERSGWVTQKPIALYSRMILASSNPGDVVFDPFCGCATTLVAAENAGRQWVGIDRHVEAKVQVVKQLNKLNEQSEDWLRKVNIETKPPKRTDLRKHGALRKKHKTTLYEQQSGDCKGCGQHFESRNMTIDHIVPVAPGFDGKDEKANWQLLCFSCNQIKGARTMSYLMSELRNRNIIE